MGYTQANRNYIKEASKFKKAFEKLLYDVISCSEGVVDDKIFKAGEVITEYTLLSERKTSHLTGSEIDENITKLEAKLWENIGSKISKINSDLVKRVERINQRCLELLKGLICFKVQTLKNVLQCKMFTMNYPLLIEHIIREAKLYEKYIMNLEEGNRCKQDDLREIELFWNQIMMEHALFIRGFLDPTENDLIMTADNFAQQYSKLLCDAREMTDRTISSLIIPLLADHVLREANHYIRLSEQK